MVGIYIYINTSNLDTNHYGHHPPLYSLRHNNSYIFYSSLWVINTWIRLSLGPVKLHLYVGTMVWLVSNLLTPAKGQKLSYNGESVNVSKIDTFIFLKPGILGKNNPSIWAPFLKLFLFLGVPSLNISSICQWDSPYRKKTENFWRNWVEIRSSVLHTCKTKISWEPYDNDHK